MPADALSSASRRHVGLNRASYSTILWADASTLPGFQAGLAGLIGPNLAAQSKAAINASANSTPWLRLYCRG